MHYIQSTGKSNPVTPELVLAAVSVELVVPCQHLLTSVFLGSLVVDGSMGVANIQPERILLIRQFVFLTRVCPVVWEPLKTCAFGWREASDDVADGYCARTLRD